MHKQTGQQQEQLQRTHLGLRLHSLKIICILVNLFLSLVAVVLLATVGGFAAQAGSAVTAVVTLAVPLLGIGGSALCCWVPSRSGARPLIIASLACDAAVILLGGLSTLLLVAGLAWHGPPARMFALIAAVGGLHLLSVVAAVLALVLFLLFLGRLAGSLHKKSLGREASTIVIHLAILVAGIFLGGFLLSFIGAVFAMASPAAGLPLGGGAILGLALLLRVVRGATRLHGRFQAMNRTTLSYMLSHENDPRAAGPSLSKLPWILWLAPPAAAASLLGGLNGGSILGRGFALVGAVMLFAVVTWLLVRVLNLIVSVRDALPTTGDTWEMLRTLPGWFWLAPSAAATLLVGVFVALLAVGVGGGAPPGLLPQAAANGPVEAGPQQPAAPPHGPPPQATPPQFRPPKVPPPATDFPGLLAYWPFEDDNPAERVADRSANRNDGKAVGATRVDGIRGKALAFANQGYFDYGAGPGLNFPATGAFTLACWVKTPSPVGMVISQRNSRDDGADIDLYLSGGRLMADVRQDGGIEPLRLASQFAANDDRWHHFALRREGKTVELFVDGARATRASGDQADGAITTDLRAIGREGRWLLTGRQDPGGSFTGAADEFCIFNRALSPEEIKSLAGR